jgi:hypothetical protein
MIDISGFEKLIRTYCNETNNNLIESANDIISIYKDILRNEEANRLLDTVTISDYDYHRHANALKFIMDKIQNIEEFGILLHTACTKNTGFDIDIGLIITSDKLYNSCITAILNYFKNKIITEEREQEQEENSEFVVLLEYGLETKENRFSPDLSVVLETINTSIRKELHKTNSEYKIVTKKITRITKKINQNIVKRRQWKPFNIDDEDKCCNQIQNTPLEIIRESQNIEPSTTKTTLASNSTTQITCRNCGVINDHFTAKCPRQRYNINNNDNDYNNNARRQYYSIQVSNVPEYYEENDIKDLFSTISRIYRVNRVKDRRTGADIGICYINYDSEEAVERAIKRFNGYRMDSSIISVTKAQNRR